MGLWDKMRGELVDIVEYLDDGSGALAARFERHKNEIKYGAKLIVRPGQMAVFINEGKLADVFKPGTHTLETRNLPLLSTLLSWKYGFQSPFKAEVVFVRTTRVTDLKWGTKNPVMMRDAEFGPIRLRAFGSYAIEVVDPATFVKQVVGTDDHFVADEVSEQLRNMIVAKFGDLLAETQVPILDLAAQYDELADSLGERLQPSLREYGLDLRNLSIENVSLPPEVEKAVDERTRMNLAGNLGTYTQFKTAQAIEAAANNPADGGAASGMGMGLGFGMGSQMMNQVGAAASPSGTATPPALPSSNQWFLARNGKPYGPFDVEGLRVQASGGALSQDTLVWREGLAQWTPASACDELAALFGSTPPPVPPPLPPTP